MTSNSLHGRAVSIRRTFSAAIDEVFAAWADPQRLREWISPHGPALVDLDFRVGGRFRIVMQGPDREIEHVGHYRDIDPPHRLVFTWESQYTGAQASLVTVALSSISGGTELLLTHQLLPPEQVDSHGGGWSLILEKLGAHLGQEVRHGN
jgi:uncharacterized protein YndB with AHSA1/START domain